MNIFKTIAYVLLFITSAVSAQTKRIQFISEENQLPLSDVEVYEGTLLIGKSDPNGYLDIKKVDSNYLCIIKESYSDSLIKVSDVGETVILKKLNKTVADKKAKIGVRKTLNRIRRTVEDGIMWGDKEKYKLPQYFTEINQLLMETDTLHYLNGLIKHEKGKGYLIDKNYRLVKNFTTKGDLYYVNNSHLVIYSDLIYPYIIDFDFELSGNILERRKNYHYTITDLDNFYKVEFTSKNNSPFDYNGYLIVDKKDFGVYEFRAQLSGTNNFRQKYMDEKYKDEIHNITATNYYLKYQKDKDNNYQLICSYSDIQFEKTLGNFKGQKFSYSSKIEAGVNDKNVVFKDFNIRTYELK
ncbi:MAG: hypothetical protein ACI7YS_01805 [Flavobacterium sp.]